MQTFHFELGELPPPAEALRAEVREFLRRELGDTPPVLRAHSWGGFDRAFSQKLGARVDGHRADVAWVHPQDAHGLFVELRHRESYT